MLCPIVVGRETELGELATRVDAALAGRGSLVVLTGEAGLGKSRLVGALADRARDAGMLVLTGRAVPSTSPTPYRPLTEAFLGLSRTGTRPTGPELVGFAGPIGRLVPDWRTPDAPEGDDSPLLVGEAVVRLLRVLASGRGCLLVVEDLHWADPETAAVVEYLADALADEAAVCVATARPEGGRTAELLTRIPSRGAAFVYPLAPLPEHEQVRMVEACLATDSPPGELCTFVTKHSDGVPFLVEELLAGLSNSGVLVADEGGWHADGALIPSVPASFADSVRTRVERMGPGARDVLGAAALLGRRFDWSLLPGLTGADGTAVVDILRSARSAQLIDVDGQEFRFRHALTREAVLAELLPFERIAFGRAALDAVRLAHPALEGSHCELAAELAEVAGDRESAAALLTESARRAIERGALDSARTAGERAVRNAVPGTSTAADALEVLVLALAHAGDARRAAELGNTLADLLATLGASPRRVAELHMVLARSAIAAGAKASARQHLADARSQSPGDAELACRLDALAAHVAMDSEQPEEAEQLASSAVSQAAELGLADVECAALEVLGRTSWHRDLARGIDAFERMERTATTHRLTYWRVSAVANLAMLRSDEGLGPLLHSRRVAAEAGALASVAQADMFLAEVTLAMLDEPTCSAAAKRSVDASRRFGLATLPVALMWQAGAAVLHRDGAEMERLLGEALAVDPDDLRILADSWGRIRALDRLLDDDMVGMRAALDTCMEYVRIAPLDRSLYFGRALWTLLRTLDDPDLGAPARSELRESRLTKWGGGMCIAIAADAIAYGREGRKQDAERTWNDARVAASRRFDGFWTSGGVERLVAEAAVRDGWGCPETWLRELEVYYADKGYDKPARACRALMVKAGAPAPRRGRGDSVVPAALRALGVTSREMDVLLLVTKGLSNREIAEQLVLSPRTVENHVANLLRRVDATDRGELRRIAEEHLARAESGPAVQIAHRQSRGG